jgi:membrane-bound lytic murein transglycosylase B
MTKGGRFKTASFGALLALVWMTTKVGAAQCGSTAAGFETWKQQFAAEARGKGVSAAGIAALMATKYANATIAADRGQRSFRLSLDQFLAKRGGSAIVARGRALKQSHASLFASIQQRYGVPAGPLIAIWGMETAFGSQRGHQNVLSAVATLAYDCRRPAYFTEQLYAALTLVDRGVLSAHTRGSMHGNRPDTIPAEEHPDLWHWKSRRREPRAHLHGKFPQGPWLALRRGVPARGSQFRGASGVECCSGLSAGHRAYWPAD